MELILLVAAGALLDYLRGGHSVLWARLPSLPASLLLGALVAYATGVDGWWIAAVAVAFALGEAPGWGSVLGPVIGGKLNYNGVGESDREEWQVGFLRGNLLLALIARGAMWAAPVLALQPWVNAWPIALGVFISFPLAALVVRRLSLDPLPRWQVMELLRGAMTVAITAGFACAPG